MILGLFGSGNNRPEPRQNFGFGELDDDEFSFPPLDDDEPDESDETEDDLEDDLIGDDDEWIEDCIPGYSELPSADAIFSDGEWVEFDDNFKQDDFDFDSFLLEQGGQDDD